MIKRYNKQITSQRWLVNFICSAIIILLFFAVFIFAFDPCFQYRVENRKYFFYERYVAPGLISNYDYDTLVIGSSRAANFDMALFREKFEVKPLLIGIGGMGVKDLTKLMEIAEDVQHAERYYVCIDYSMFLSDRQLVPEYLYHKDILSRWKYATSYEAWFRFIPADICGSIMHVLDISMPKIMEDKMEIDRYSNWNDYTDSGEKEVISTYVPNKKVLSEFEKEDTLDSMQTEIDAFIDSLNLSRGEYIFFFPPYSCLWWCDVENTGHAEVYYEAKKYFIKRVADKGTIYDFQHAALTLDLNNYCDSGHYDQNINDWMIEQFSNNQYKVTTENINEKLALMKKNTSEFRKEYLWLWQDTK